MLLSVVIPVYNGAQFIEDAVQSIYDQTFLPEAFEIFLVDDASSDNSFEVCQRIASEHHEIKLLRHDVNKGVAAARNLGIKSASGEFLAMLDQDDTWHPKKLERQFQVFQDDPKIEVVLGKLNFRLVGLEKFPIWFRPKWAESPAAGYVFGCILVRRSMFLEVGLLDETFRMADDYDWFARVKSRCIKEYMVPEVTLERKIHSANASSQTKISTSECLKLIRRKISLS